MKLSTEVKNAIKKEYNEFKESMYAGKSLAERQKLDQFFTPPEISIRLIEELSDLTGNILDPTCGSGNLLAACLIAGADPDKVFGNDYDQVMVDACRARLQKINPKVQDWQVHRGDATDPKCLTDFAPNYAWKPKEEQTEDELRVSNTEDGLNASLDLFMKNFEVE